MIIYCDDIHDIFQGQLYGFFVGWKKPLTAESHYALLKGSTHFIAAVDNETDKIVGFVTALSDGINSSFIPLLEVLPEYQGCGIGTTLMQKILTKLENVANVDLTCDIAVQSFYERFEMFKSNGMVLRKYL